ncbi:MAG: dihydrolipoamide acetyltransferase family protein [Halieaceae bacterium]
MSNALDAVTIPKWGIEMTHGTIVAWHKSVGDTVTAGEEIVDIETDKIVNSFEARTSGTLVRILAEVGDELPVGQLIGVIAADAVEEEAIEAFVVAQRGDAASGESSEAEAAVVADRADAAAPVSLRIAPALRRKLQQAGIDPANVAPTGPHGRIVKADVDRALEQGESAAGGGQPLSSQQATVARKLSQAQSSLPLYHVTMDVDAGAALSAVSGDASLNDAIIAAVQRALLAHPELNQTFDGERLTAVDGQAVAVAVATDENIVLAPVIHTPAGASLDELSRESKDVIQRARSGRLASADQSPAAITVSNLGMYGVASFTAMVTPPQIMVLSVGTVRRVPVFNEADELVARSMMNLTLGSDHRVVNGAQAASFLATIRSELEAAS